VTAKQRPPIPFPSKETEETDLFEAMYREGLRKRGSYLSQFVEAPRAAAE